MTPRRRRQPLAAGQTRTRGQDQPHNPAGNTQPEPSQAQQDILVAETRPGLIDIAPDRAPLVPAAPRPAPLASPATP